MDEDILVAREPWRKNRKVSQMMQLNSQQDTPSPESWHDDVSGSITSPGGPFLYGSAL